MLCTARDGLRYDDKVLITFNYKEGTETVAFGEAVKAEKSSDMSARGAPDFERQIVRFDVLFFIQESDCILSAPPFAQPAFLCIHKISSGPEMPISILVL